MSTATVSRVLTGLDGVGEETKNRVLRAIKKLDYFPNRVARGLRARQRKVIGLVLPDLQNPFFTGVARGVEDVLYRYGYILVLGHSDGLAEREQTHLSVLRGEGAAGIILIAGNASGADYEHIRTWNIPVVAVDREPKGLEVDVVGTDNREGSRLAVEHLVAHGYSSIAFLNGPEGFTVTHERLAGYLEGLASAGILANPAHIVHSDFRQAGGKEAMASLLALPQPPRAVLIANNLMTLGALEAIHEKGALIPEDLAVISFDDMPWATSLRPPITAVAQPTEELGRAAAEMLLARLADPGRLPRQVTLPTRLIIRASCGSHASAPAAPARPSAPANNVRI